MGADYPTCSPGFYITKGVSPLTGESGLHCAPCELGYYCEGGQTDEMIPCPAGMRGLYAGQSTQEKAC